MTNTETATRSTTPVTIGRTGTVVHAATGEGIVVCGSQRRGQRPVTFLPADTEVTCTKCTAPKSTKLTRCEIDNFPLNRDGSCPLAANH